MVLFCVSLCVCVCVLCFRAGVGGWVGYGRDGRGAGAKLFLEVLAVQVSELRASGIRVSVLRCLSIFVARLDGSGLYID